ncbi:MAG: UDP-N-acetylglucosamine 2-epimerase (non-hydrolyzing), partial [Enterococcus aquimarinus]
EEVVYREMKQLLTDPDCYQKMAHAKNPYGDGQASANIITAITNYFSL